MGFAWGRRGPTACRASPRGQSSEIIFREQAAPQEIFLWRCINTHRASGRDVGRMKCNDALRRSSARPMGKQASHGKAFHQRL